MLATAVLPEVIVRTSEYIPGNIPEGCTETDNVAGPVPEAGEIASHDAEAAAVQAVAAEIGTVTDCAAGGAPAAESNRRYGGVAFGCAPAASDAVIKKSSTLIKCFTQSRDRKEAVTWGG